MAEQFVRVVLGEGDEQQLTDLGPDDYVEFVGSINGQPIAVRFYRPEDAESTAEDAVRVAAAPQLIELNDGGLVKPSHPDEKRP